VKKGGSYSSYCPPIKRGEELEKDDINSKKGNAKRIGKTKSQKKIVERGRMSAQSSTGRERGCNFQTRLLETGERPNRGEGGSRVENGYICGHGTRGPIQYNVSRGIIEL